jgi:hypothetical protein
MSIPVVSAAKFKLNVWVHWPHSAFQLARSVPSIDLRCFWSDILISQIAHQNFIHHRWLFLDTCVIVRWYTVKRLPNIGMEARISACLRTQIGGMSLIDVQDGVSGIGEGINGTGNLKI